MGQVQSEPSAHPQLSHCIELSYKIWPMLKVCRKICMAARPLARRNGAVRKRSKANYSELHSLLRLLAVSSLFLVITTHTPGKSGGLVILS